MNLEPLNPSRFDNWDEAIAALPGSSFFHRNQELGFYSLLFLAQALSAAELPGNRPDEIRIRSFSWPNAGGDDETQGQGALSVRTLTVDTQQHRVTGDTGI